MPHETTTTMQVRFSVAKPNWLTSNRHETHLPARAATVRRLHQLAGWTARTAGVPAVPGPVALLWTIHYPKGVGWIHGDASNAQPTTKAILDGLVDVGVLPGDGPRVVVSETFRRGANLDVPGLHQVTLSITSAELAEPVPA